MKTLLQQVATGRFLKGRHAWTLEEKRARTFSSSLAALEFCADHGLADLEIVVKFSDSRFDIRLHPFARLSTNSQCRPSKN